MAQDPLITVQNVKSLDLLITLEGNLERNDAISPDIETAIEARYADFGRDLIADKTGLDLSDLSPAEAASSMPSAGMSLFKSAMAKVPLGLFSS